MNLCQNETLSIQNLFDGYQSYLKPVSTYVKAILTELYEPYIYRPKPSASAADLSKRNEGHIFTVLRYNDTLYLAVKNPDALPDWLDDTDNGKILITNEILNDCQYYTFGAPSFFNPVGVRIVSVYHLDFHFRAGLPKQQCEIEIDGQKITGTLSEIGFTHMDLTLDIMPKFQKHIESKDSGFSEFSLIKKRKLSEYAEELAKSELKKLFIDYRFFFVDYKDEIRTFFKNYYAPHYEELKQLQKDRQISKKSIKQMFDNGEISASEMEKLLQKRKEAGEKYGLIINQNLSKELGEYSKANWNREIKYTRYYSILNDYLLKD